MENIFEGKKPNIKKLLEFGFKKEKTPQKKGFYTFCAFLSDGEFKLTVKIDDKNFISTTLVETQTNEIYNLHLVDSANGEFVGKIKKEYNEILDSIYEKCFEYDSFKNSISKDIIKYIKEKYKDELEYLWEKSPDSAIIRRCDNLKWYLVFLKVQKNKLNLDGGEVVEIIDLRAEPDEINEIVDNKKYFRGYHMNKKHWLTMILDGSVLLNEILDRIDNSYNLAGKR